MCLSLFLIDRPLHELELPIPYPAHVKCQMFSASQAVYRNRTVLSCQTHSPLYRLLVSHRVNIAGKPARPVRRQSSVLSLIPVIITVRGPDLPGTPQILCAVAQDAYASDPQMCIRDRFNTRETVETETPASCATSLIPAISDSPLLIEIILLLYQHLPAFPNSFCRMRFPVHL